jgi:type I restriction enzyme S subunit
MDRPWIEAGLKWSVVREVDEGSLLVQRVSLLRAREGQLDQRFLAAIIGSREFTEYVLSVQTGTGVPHISSRQIGEYEVELPDINLQRNAGELYSRIERAIELNERLNAALATAAAAVFKSWFVDFDPVVAKSEGRRPFGMTDEVAALFPNQFDANGVPDGWKATKVRGFLKLSKQQVNPMSAPTSLFEHYSIPAFDSGQEPRIEVGGSIKSNKFLVPSSCILLSKLNPTTPRIWWPWTESPVTRICSTEFMVVVPDVGVPLSFCYALSSSPEVLDQLCSLVTGTSNSHQRVKPEDFLDLAVSNPGRDILTAFDRVVGPLFARRLLNQKQNQALRKLRDAILPGLVSGELQIRDAEREVAGVLG